MKTVLYSTAKHRIQTRVKDPRKDFSAASAEQPKRDQCPYSHKSSPREDSDEFA